VAYDEELAGRVKPLALAVFPAGYRDLTREAYTWTCTNLPAGAAPGPCCKGPIVSAAGMSAVGAGQSSRLERGHPGTTIEVAAS
jgi:hypothetical protein